MGNTPAYAGKTPSSLRDFPAHRKHPRLRGEDPGAILLMTDETETPPLTRGRHLVKSISSSYLRNTPAYAGKTQREDHERSAPWKHPRLRGEDLNADKTVESEAGNTPAYAGKTRAIRRWPRKG